MHDATMLLFMKLFFTSGILTALGFFIVAHFRLDSKWIPVGFIPWLLVMLWGIWGVLFR